ncbi:MAG: hypothetical protein ACU84Q_18075 [Gammaproteobacteria bacterium]
MGYVTDRGEQQTFEFNTRLPGNANVGHEWGTGRATAAQRSKDLGDYRVH